MGRFLGRPWGFLGRPWGVLGEAMGQALQWGFLKSPWGESWVVEAGPILQSCRAQAPTTGLFILDAAAYHFLERAVWSAQGQGALCGVHSVQCSGPRHAPWGCPCLPPAHPPEHVCVSVRSGSYLTNSENHSQETELVWISLWLTCLFSAPRRLLQALERGRERQLCPLWERNPPSLQWLRV